MHEKREPHATTLNTTSVTAFLALVGPTARPGGLSVRRAQLLRRSAHGAKQKVKLDSKLVKMARELRDRWLEQVKTQHLRGYGKYDVTRDRGAEARADPHAEDVRPHRPRPSCPSHAGGGVTAAAVTPAAA